MLTFSSIFSLVRCYKYMCVHKCIYKAAMFYIYGIRINIYFVKILRKEDMVAFTQQYLFQLEGPDTGLLRIALAFKIIPLIPWPPFM